MPSTFWVTAVLLFGVVSACTRAKPQSVTPTVVASVDPQAYFLEQIAGDRVRVEVMVPPGASPETYEPSIMQMRAMSRAAVYVKVGHPNFPFEQAWLNKLLEDYDGIEIIDSSVGIELAGDDPHIWVSPACVRVMAKNITSGLRDLLPDDVAVLDQRLATFLSRVDAIDMELRRRLAPYRGGKFLVFHPAWSYLAREYGLEQVSIEHEAKEVTSHQLADIVQTAKQAGLRVVLVQPQFSRASAQVVAEQIGGEVVAVDPLARDWFANLRQVAGAFERALAR